MKAGNFCWGLVLMLAATTLMAAQTPRIINGDQAPPGAWPWMTALFYSDADSPYRGVFCGGTLIDDDWLVTAGHCVFEMSPPDIDVAIGVDNLRQDLSAGIGERIGAKRIIIHPEYDSDLMYNDIALIQIEQPTSYASAPIIDSRLDLSGDWGTILGWGDTNPRWPSDYPANLMQAEVPIVSNASCMASYGPDEITENMLCAGFAAGGVDTCQGDSGGPLVVYNNGQWMLAGITSWGDGCARPGQYGVYTRVADYRAFIDEAITTDYVACADANADGIVNDADISAYRDRLRAEQRDWINNCLIPQALCGDVTGDGVVNNADKRQRIAHLRGTAREWYQLCWKPEVNTAAFSSNR
ncbi:trypsin-like serine protease [Rhabdochromatium marinum]|uniref:trypsin-like serine protease n=1 Tax=Rhabdochromatium marinum TaxID=48729 RepID=UPI0019051395|nr:trypsin-like serine protease [Rhabdochromatium marinum]MBK1649195.1 hypothetical protein [Rhabdochromatium marinum]